MPEHAHRIDQRVDRHRLSELDIVMLLFAGRAPVSRRLMRSLDGEHGQCLRVEVDLASIVIEPTLDQGAAGAREPALSVVVSDHSRLPGRDARLAGVQGILSRCVWMRQAMFVRSSRLSYAMQGS